MGKERRQGQEALARAKAAPHSPPARPEPGCSPRTAAPRADSCWGCYPLRNSSGRVSNTRRGLWERGGLGHFLGTSPFCSRPRSHSTPEQPHLRNQVTTRRKSMLPSWTPGKGVCSMTRGLIQPTAGGATKKDQPPLSTSGHKHTHSFRSRLLQLPGAYPMFLREGSVPWSFHSQKSSLWPQGQLSVPSPTPKPQQDASPLLPF